MRTRKAGKSDGVMHPDHVRVVTLLESAEGRWLSYGALEAQGVPNPALAGYELAAAGWAIMPAVVTDSGGRRQLGLRLAGNGAGPLADRR
jgi:hypothetical protein